VNNAVRIDDCESNRTALRFAEPGQRHAAAANFFARRRAAAAVLRRSTLGCFDLKMSIASLVKRWNSDAGDRRSNFFYE
jgi:hypothetical protein